MTSETWYIVKQAGGHCEILSGDLISSEGTSSPSSESSSEAGQPSIKEQWGPFASQGEAIARRVGLIRAGKCQPI